MNEEVIPLCPLCEEEMESRLRKLVCEECEVEWGGV